MATALIINVETGQEETVTVPDPVTPVPASVTRRQARIVLSRHGYLATVEAALAGMEGQAGEEARIEWADASEFRRDHPLIAAIAAILGLTEQQIDALFIEAAAIA